MPRFDDNDSEEEMASFSFTDDDFGKRRRNRGMTQEQAMLGIWAEDDEDNDNDTQHQNKKLRGTTSWVKSGSKAASDDNDDGNNNDNSNYNDDNDDDDDDDDDDSDADDNDEDDEAERRPMMGLGFSSFSSNKGKKSNSGSSNSSSNASTKNIASSFTRSSSSAANNNSNSNSFLNKNEKSNENRFQNNNYNNDNSASSVRNEFAGLGSTGNTKKSKQKSDRGEDIASWEKHTKGFGSKLLKKYGYVEGLGLGSKGEGMAVPIEVKLRPGKTLGLGVVSELTPQQREEEKRKAMLRKQQLGIDSVDEDENDEGSDNESAGRRRRSAKLKSGRVVDEEDEISAARDMLEQEMAYNSNEENINSSRSGKRQSKQQQQQQQQQRQPHWKKGSAPSSASASYGNKKTVKQVIAMSKLQRPETAPKQVIMDFTQRETRVVSSLSELQSQQNTSTMNSPSTMVLDDSSGAEPLPSSTMPELQYNLKLLVELSEADIQSSFQKIQLEESHLTKLAEEQSSLESVLEQDNSKIDRLKELAEILVKCHEKVSHVTKRSSKSSGGGSNSGEENDDENGLKLVLDVFQLLRNQFTEEYKQFNLASLALSYALPFVTDLVENWKIFDETNNFEMEKVLLLPPSNPFSPSFGTTLVFEWKQLLDLPQPKSEHDHNVERLFGPSTSNKLSGSTGTTGTTGTTGSSSSSAATAITTPYDKLIWDIWVPFIRGTLVHWSPRHSSHLLSEKLVAVLTSWSHLIPDWIGENICEQLIVPRLVKDVEHWNPVLDPTPIHSWLFPFIPLLGLSRFSILFPTIKYKLMTALTEWHPSDFSAHSVLTPWKAVLPTAEFTNLLSRSIAPKLAQSIRELTINPAHQESLDPISWLIGWMDLFKDCRGLLVNILAQELFPKWHKVLSAWLASDPDFEEVTQWYIGWKSLFPATLLSDPIIANHFTKALTTMNQHLDPTFVSEFNNTAPTAKSTPSLSASTSTSAAASSKAFKPTAPASNAAVSEASFKNIIEKLAEDNSLLFMPTPQGKRVDGNTVYMFGKALIYIDRAVVFAQNGSVWMPVGLDKLVTIARE